jgi:hypothetical protein
VDGLDVAFRRLRNARLDAYRREGGVLGTVRRGEFDDAAVLDDVDFREMVWTQQRLPHVDGGLLRGGGATGDEGEKDGEDARHCFAPTGKPAV